MEKTKKYLIKTLKILIAATMIIVTLLSATANVHALSFAGYHFGSDGIRKVEKIQEQEETLGQTNLEAQEKNQKKLSNEEIAEAIKFAWLNEKSLRNWGRIGGKIVRRNFSWEMVARNLEKHLLSLE